MQRLIEENLETWRRSVGRKPLILKGAREVGKTYLLKKGGNRTFGKVHEVNFEKNPEAAKIFERDFDVKRIIRELGFLLKSKIQEEHDLLILDEIQAAPKALWHQDYGLAKGYFAENFVMQELRAAQNQHLWPLYAWSEGESEIEVIRPYRGTVIPVDVKAGHRIQAKSLAQFRKRYQPPLAIKISANPIHHQSETGQLQLPLYLASWAGLLD